MTFSQSTGVLVVGPIKWTGYAGRDAGKNNPAMQDRQGIGPLPRGWYTVDLKPKCTGFDAKTGVCPHCGQINDHKHGPYVLWLIPDPENEMFDRGDFRIHGDSIHAPGTASMGCICQAQEARRAIVACGDSRLEVTE